MQPGVLCYSQTTAPGAYQPAEIITFLSQAVPGAQRGYSARVWLGELGSEPAVILHAPLTSLTGLPQPPRPPHRCTLCILTESIQGHICKVSRAGDIPPGDSGPVVSFSGS